MFYVSSQTTDSTSLEAAGYDDAVDCRIDDLSSAGLSKAFLVASRIHGIDPDLVSIEDVMDAFALDGLVLAGITGDAKTVVGGFKSISSTAAAEELELIHFDNSVAGGCEVVEMPRTR